MFYTFPTGLPSFPKMTLVVFLYDTHNYMIIMIYDFLCCNFVQLSDALISVEWKPGLGQLTTASLNYNCIFL